MNSLKKFFGKSDVEVFESGRKSAELQNKSTPPYPSSSFS